MTISSTPRFTLTDAERDLLPSAADVQFYAAHGWYLSKKLFTDDEVDELVAASDRYYAGERDRDLPVRPPRLAYWDPSKGDVQRHNDYVHYEHDGLANLLRKPLIGAVAAALAQADEIRVFQSTMIYKPPIACRADQHRAVALRQALLVDLHLGPDADRVHPVPRLRRGDGHHHDGRRQPPLAGDRQR